MPDTNKAEQALNAVEKANNAVGQTKDHPSDRMIEQADNAVIHANVAVGQANESGNESEGLSNAAAQLNEDESVLDDYSF